LTDVEFIYHGSTFISCYGVVLSTPLAFQTQKFTEWCVQMLIIVMMRNNCKQHFNLHYSSSFMNFKFNF
jgi:hypothetical protein